MKYAGDGQQRPHDKRQLGARIGKCSTCGRTVWSNQPNLVVTVDPLALAHVRCQAGG